ncbi:MAG: hypothetical protein CSB47_02520 [Proteobacteria bacterium]|nr:MAG: hypothetical protein CSB47_02520 [Pseudomonadota bacterium]
MFKKIKILSLMVCGSLLLAACHDDNEQLTMGAPKQVSNVTSAIYGVMRGAGKPDDKKTDSEKAANKLFTSFGAPEIGSEKCQVKVYRMSYDTIGGAGEKATSSGVFMLPYGDDPACNGSLPVMLYAHGTTVDKGYDLSRFIIDSGNAASKEAVLLLAAYAANGYAVIAPNYAGYADSSLGYHPYVDEKQQSTEMIDALEHARNYAGMLGAELSPKLFISGLSQGGYVAMATHKALEAKGETVTASLPISGPYAMLDFVDTIFAGYVNAGATVFAPMILTSLQKSDGIYNDASEVYDAKYAGIAENFLPKLRAEGSDSVDRSALPGSAVFGGEPPTDANLFNKLGFADDHLLSDAFRQAYLSDVMNNRDTPVYKVRSLIAKRDLRNWQPGAPMMLCGVASDPVVYYLNTEAMVEYWAGNPYVSSVDMTEQMAGVPVIELHQATGAFCTGAALKYFAKVM